jgi:hypothetical protein
MIIHSNATIQDPFLILSPYSTLCLLCASICMSSPLTPKLEKGNPEPPVRLLIAQPSITRKTLVPEVCGRASGVCSVSHRTSEPAIHAYTQPARRHMRCGRGVLLLVRRGSEGKVVKRAPSYVGVAECENQNMCFMHAR